ncbi:hypothetical protein KIW84_072134 [Lathyrus oleraceus]|uniref:Uncharacterized protein n=1 Tax=Pisum sativum TaxID=3888 RepID=A0A9D4ZWS8_PEA|nr:hypothetical protein KIW84_072134 [Pisum sativum]
MKFEFPDEDIRFLKSKDCEEPIPEEGPDPEFERILMFDGAVNVNGSGVGAVLVTPKGSHIPFAARLTMEAVLPVEVQIPSWRVLMDVKLKETKWIRTRYEELSLIEEKRLATICQGQWYHQRMKRAFDRKVRPRVYHVGDMVLKRILPPQNDRQGKWTPNYEGPFVVKKVFSGGALLLTTMDGAVRYFHSLTGCDVKLFEKISPWNPIRDKELNNGEKTARELRRSLNVNQEDSSKSEDWRVGPNLRRSIVSEWGEVENTRVEIVTSPASRKVVVSPAEVCVGSCFPTKSPSGPSSVEVIPSEGRFFPQHQCYSPTGWRLER